MVITGIIGITLIMIVLIINGFNAMNRERDRKAELEGRRLSLRAKETEGMDQIRLAEIQLETESRRLR